MLEGVTPWPPEFAARYRRLGYWQGRTLGDLFDTWTEAHADRVALVGPSDRLTYAELRGRVDRLALHLLDLGLRRNDRLILQLPTSPEFVALYFALLKVGILPVMALPPHRQAEISHLVGVSEAVAYAVPESNRGFDYRTLAEAIRPELRGRRLVLVAGDDPGRSNISLARLMAEPAAGEDRARERLGADPPAASDVALFLLSGGTTGLPKLIPRTHDDYACNSRASAGVCGFGPESVYAVSLPISHNFPLASPGIQGVLQNGGRIVIPASNEPEAVFEAIEKERVTVTSLVPAQAIRWLESTERARFDLSSLAVLQVGGARLSPEVARRIEPVLGCRLQQVFGMAEGLLNYTRLDDRLDEIVETQGRPCTPDDEIRIVDAEGHDVPDGTPGELLTRGPYTIRGYFRADDYNGRAFTADGFYRTGDVVRRSARGNLVVEGRVKDMINRGGEKISAEDVENMILAHPAVSEVAVVAMPDEVMGERACAYVVLRPGAALDLEGLKEHLLGFRIAKFKLPERLELVDGLPLTNVGKVSKAQLRADIAEKLERERASRAAERQAPTSRSR